MAVTDEFYTFNLMEIHVKNVLEFQGFLHCILFITKVKPFQVTIDRSSFEKQQKSFLIIEHCGRVRSNSDFMVSERVECLYFE